MLDYDRLSTRILCALTGELLPDTSWHVPERNEQRIAIAVCDATGMTPERWDRLSEDERIPWLHKTLKALEKQPAPNAWVEGDDLPDYRPELAREPTGDNSPPPAGLNHLSRFDLPTTFRCAVELAEAAASLTEQEWADVSANCEGPASPHFERQMEADRRLRRIEEETERLKRILGAKGPLEHDGGPTDVEATWDGYDQHFNNTVHDRVVRLSLWKLATSAVDLSGFAAWREWQWPMRETGLRLLTWGLAQLWEGMSGEERSRVRDRLLRTHKAVGWPADLATDPKPYDGPEEIPLEDQYRIVSNYVSCHRNYLDDLQKAGKDRVRESQEKFLRRATLEQFVEAAERAAQALQAISKGDYTSQLEWAELYTKTIGPLDCLRRAREVPPIEEWPAAALQQRNLLAVAAGRLLVCVASPREVKASLKPADADEAFEEFTSATSRLRDEVGGQFIERLLAGPGDVELSLNEMALLEAHLGQPISFATIQQEKKATGYSPTEVNRNKLMLIQDFNRGLQVKAEAPKKASDAAPAIGPSEATVAAAPGNDASIALLRVYTNGLADDRIEKATRLLTSKLTVNEKLTKIDDLIRLPATASAEQLGEMLGVTKQAVLKTDWWIQNRKGEKDSEIGRRRAGHQKRAKDYEPPGTNDDRK